jgi:hypothetical protein
VSRRNAPAAGGASAREAPAGPVVSGTACPTCGFVAEGIRCPRCNALKAVACGGACSRCPAAKGGCSAA